MRVGMVRMDMVRRPKVHRVLSLVLCSLALVGWGAFADLRAELAHLKASQDQLLAERKQQQEAVGNSPSSKPRSPRLATNSRRLITSARKPRRKRLPFSQTGPS